MLHKYFLRCRIAAEAEGGINLYDRLVPLQLTFVNQLGQQKGGHALGIRGDHIEGMGIGGGGLAEFAYTYAAFINDLSMVDQGKRSAGYAQGFGRGLNKAAHGLDARCIESMGGLAGKGFARIANRPQAGKGEIEGGAALFIRTLAGVFDNHRPVRPFAQCHSSDIGMIIWRGFVGDIGALIPAVLGGHRADDLDRPSLFGTVEFPGGGSGGPGIGCVADVGQRHVGITFRCVQDGDRAYSPHRPVLWRRIVCHRQ